ncbi:hypothetical protein [Azohydromonas aeria]|uniref:hypothetical protein n=1 Tax=Azohydromonas aeria TaxID=2590212 RepID=UPI0012F79AF6|nr:hypothetical protein [Azohydromonas aeria]
MALPRPHTVPQPAPVPDDVLDEIAHRAKENWPDDTAQQRRAMRCEAAGWLRLQSLDFGPQWPLSSAFIASARRSFDAWHEVALCVEMELQALRRLQRLSYPGIGAGIVAAWKRQAREAGEEFHAGQLEWIERQARKYQRLLDAGRTARVSASCG